MRAAFRLPWEESVAPASASGKKGSTALVPQLSDTRTSSAIASHRLLNADQYKTLANDCGAEFRPSSDFYCKLQTNVVDNTTRVGGGSGEPVIEAGVSGDGGLVERRTVV